MPVSSCKKNIAPFLQQLSSIVPSTVSDNKHCTSYLLNLLKHQRYFVNIYATALDELLQHSTKKIEDCFIVDIGCGNGLLAIFAKYCGFKKVYASDINADFLASAKTLSNLMNIAVDEFICGDMSELQKSITGPPPDAFIGTDVIEHIYNLETFMAAIASINPEAVTVFTTASNPSNYFKVRKLQQQQIRDEEVGYAGQNVDTEAHEAFFEMRRKIIASTFKSFTDDEVEALTKATRGKIKEDILKAVQHFINTGDLPQPAADYNTCDPYTGSWSERILPLKDYKEIYNLAGFKVSIYKGYYNSFASGNKKYISSFLNFLIQMSGTRLCPYIGIVGFKKQK